MSETISQPHDAFFRAIFGRAAHAASLFQQLLPSDVVKGLEWSALQRVDGSFVDKDLIQSQSDLLFLVPWVGSPVATGKSMLLYLLFEHQSDPDPAMAARLFEYIARIYRRDRETHPRQGPPPVITIVMAQTRGVWKASARFEENIRWPQEANARPALERFQPKFEHLLIDLGSEECAELRGDLAARMAQGVMKTRSQRPDGAWFDWFFSLVREPDFLTREPDLANLIFHYLMTTTDLHLDELETRMDASSIPAQTKQTVMTIAEQLRREGVEKGIERGMEQGLRQGLRKGLLDQLQLLNHVLGYSVDADPELLDAEIEAKIARLRKELESRLK